MTKKFLIFAAIIFLLILTNKSPVFSQNEITGGILDKNVNDKEEDYNAWVIFGVKEDTLFFTSSRGVPNRRPIALSAEMFYSTRSSDFRMAKKPINTGWSPAKQIVVNASRIAQYTRGTQAISGDRIIFAAEADMSTKTASGTSYLFDLWQMTKRVDGYSFPEPLTIVNDPDAWDSQPALSADGKVLVFVTNRKGGVGGLDLWYSVMDASGNWTKPLLVPNINTAGDEKSPHFGADGKFYYSTNWDYKNNKKGSTGQDIYRAEYETKGGMQFPVNPVNLDEAIKADADKYGLKVPKDLRYNSDADDEFPFITSDRSSIFITSNRKSSFGKRDIYAYSLPQSKIRLRVNVQEQIFDSKGNQLTPPTPKNGLSLTLTERGTGKSINITSGTEFEVEADKTYDIVFSKFVEEECYQNKIEGPEGTSIKTVKPFGMDTLFSRDVLISRRKVEIPPIIFQSTDTLPYFITGYWYPNTTENLLEYRKREASGFFNSTGFVDSTGHDYSGASTKIDKEFQDKIYNPLIKLLPSFQELCRDTLYLKVSVFGFTDPRGLSQGENHPYRETSRNKRNYPDETITVGLDERGQPVNIPTGLDMWKQKWPKDPNNQKGSWISLQDEGQNGNIILSKLRAHFTFVTFDNAMRKLSPIYAQMRDQGRVILDDEGFGIDKNGPNQGKLKDDPQSRRIEIYLDIIRPEEIQYYKRLPGGLVKEGKKFIVKANNIVPIEKSQSQPTEMPPDSKNSIKPDADITPSHADKIDVSQVQPVKLAADGNSIDIIKNPEPLPPTENQAKEVEKPKIDESCYTIEYKTYEKQDEADAALQELVNNGITDGKILQHPDAFGSFNYKLRSGCYKTANEAIQAMKNISFVFPKLNLTKKPVIVK